MIINFGYGANSRNQGYIAEGFLFPDPGGREGSGAGGVDQDTAVMTTREGMTDPRWFGFINGEKR